MISVHADIRLKEKQIILSTIQVLTELEEKSLKEYGWRRNIHGNWISGYDTYNLTKGHLQVTESEGVVSYLQDLVEASRAQLASVERYMAEECPFNLYEFQKEFVRWFNDPLKTRTSVLNACSCGLGKTVQALTAVLSTGKEKSIYIICPKNSVGNWIDHLEKFNYSLPISVGKFTPEKNGGCCILTYESLPPTKNEANAKKRYIEDYLKDIPQGAILIADEFHKCKNAKTKMVKRFRKLFTLIKKRQGKCIALTATPIMSWESDIKTLLTNIDLFKCTFGNSEVFNRLYGGEFNWIEKKMYWKPENRQPLEIKRRLKEVMFIKKKADVYEQLPEYVESTIFLDISIGKEENSVLNSLEKSIGKFTKEEENRYFTVRTALAMAKLKRSMETIEEYEDQEKPILVFGAIKRPIEELGKRTGWKCITGDTSIRDRDLYVKLANEGKLKGLAITIGSGSSALNVPGIDTSLFLEISTRPGDNNQARGRTDRINKIQDKLFYIYFVADHPVERRIYELMRGREEMVEDSY